MKFLLTSLFVMFFFVSCLVPTTVPKTEYSRNITEEAVEAVAEETEQNIFV